VRLLYKRRKVNNFFRLFPKEKASIANYRFSNAKSDFRPTSQAFRLTLKKLCDASLKKSLTFFKFRDASLKFRDASFKKGLDFFQGNKIGQKFSMKWGFFEKDRTPGDRHHLY
jgi:hypothetical protein